MKRDGDRWGKMEGYCSTGQSTQQAVVPMEEEEEEEEEEELIFRLFLQPNTVFHIDNGFRCSCRFYLSQSNYEHQ